MIQAAEVEAETPAEEAATENQALSCAPQLSSTNPGLAWTVTRAGRWSKPRRQLIKLDIRRMFQKSMCSGKATEKARGKRSRSKGSPVWYNDYHGSHR